MLDDLGHFGDQQGWESQTGAHLQKPKNGTRVIKLAAVHTHYSADALL